MPPARPTIPIHEIVGAAQVRNLASGRRHKPISRHTLIAWREGDFPKPIRTLEGAGPGGSDVELWDGREVRAWLKARR
jgi:hypothetical protein